MRTLQVLTGAIAVLLLAAVCLLAVAVTRGVPVTIRLPQPAPTTQYTPPITSGIGVCPSYGDNGSDSVQWVTCDDGG